MAIADVTTTLVDSNALLSKISDTLLSREEKDDSGGLQKLEEAKERKAHNKKMLDAILALGAAKQAGGDKTKDKGGSFLSKILPFATGLITSLFAAIFGKTGMIRRAFSGIFGKGGKISKLFGQIFGKGGKISQLFGRIFGKGGMVSRAFSGIFGKGGKISQLFGRIFGKSSTIGKLFSGIFGKGSKLSQLGGTLSNLFGKAGKLSKFGGVLKALLGPLKILMRVLGWPVTVIMAIVGAVKGFMSAYGENGSILEGIGGALLGLIDGLVGWVIELGAWLLGWILEKLGFDKEIVDKFKNFDFFEWATNFFSAIPDFVIGIVDKVKTWVKENITDKIKDFLTQTPFGRKLMEVIKPFIDFFGEVVDVIGGMFTKIIAGVKSAFKTVLEAIPSKLLAFVPDSMMKWAGMDAPPTIDEQNALAREEVADPNYIGNQLFDAVTEAQKKVDGEGVFTYDSTSENNQKALMAAEARLERFKKTEKAKDPVLIAEKLAMAKSQEALQAERQRLWDAGKYEQSQALIINNAPTSKNSTSSQTNISTGNGGGPVKTVEQFMQRQERP